MKRWVEEWKDGWKKKKMDEGVKGWMRSREMDGGVE